MLSYSYLSSPSHTKIIIDQFDPSQQTWIVSDLKSKQELQQNCLNRDGYYIDDSILRVSDFWKLWLRRLAPQIQIVSDEFIKKSIEKFVKEKSSEFKIEAHEYSTLYKYLDELSPILFSNGQTDVLAEWIKQENKIWNSWFMLAQLCLNELVAEQKIISSRWIPAYLSSLDLSLIVWGRRIILDLGSEMTSIEFGIFLALSKRIDIEVLVPDPTWKSKYKYLLHTYEVNQGFANLKNAISSDDSVAPLKPEQFFRFQTEALEVKHITNQVRDWLDSGVDAKKISLISPRLEDYWSVLKLHFDYEGIPYNKKYVSTAHTIQSFQVLLSKLKTQTLEPSWESLEQVAFSDLLVNSIIKLKFEKFKSLFVELIDHDDLKRDEQVVKMFFNTVDLNNVMGREEFLAVIIKNIIELKSNSQINDVALACIKNFIEITSVSKFNFEQWLNIFSSSLREKEIEIAKGNVDGVNLRSLQNTSLFDAEYVIWFGLDESGFMSTSKHVLTADEMEYLKYNFDFSFTYPEESHTEFNLRWLTQNNFKEQIFTSALYSFQSEPLNTSLFVLENSINPDQDFNIKQTPTRFDQTLLAYDIDTAKELKLTADHYHTFREVVPYRPQKLSPTEVSQYDQCGFKLLASSGFRLRDYPAISLDLDPRQRGNLVHDLFQYLVTDKNYQNYDAAKTENHLNSLRLKYQLYPFADDFWQIQLKRYLDVASRFSRFESDRLRLITGIKHFSEKDFKLDDGLWPYSGRIDRVDVLPSGEAVVYDYKNSPNSKTVMGTNWIAKKEYQMLFYLKAVVETFKGDFISDIKGAYYYFYKTMTVDKGLFKISDNKSSQLDVLFKNNKSKVDENTFDEILQHFNQELKRIETQITKGEYFAKPFNKDICKDCDWRQMCRAPHL